MSNTENVYPFECPWCDYEFRKERYFGRHVFSFHPEMVLKAGVDPEDAILEDWRDP